MYEITSPVTAYEVSLPHTLIIGNPQRGMAIFQIDGGKLYVQHGDRKYPTGVKDVGAVMDFINSSIAEKDTHVYFDDPQTNKGYRVNIRKMF